MGFTFNGQHSNDYGIFYKTELIPIIASKRSETVEVQGLNGQHVFEDGYNNILITLSCVVVGTKIIDRRKKARAIARWLSNTGTLIFDTEKDIEYKVVKVTNGINAEMGGNVDKFKITFECSPVQTQTFYNDSITWEDADTAWAYMNIPWVGYLRTFEVSGPKAIKVENAGTYEALPLIIITGTSASAVVGPFTITNLTGTIYVDCFNKQVYSVSGSKVNQMSKFSGDFLKLQPGSNSIDVNGTFTIEFDYKNTYL